MLLQATVVQLKIITGGNFYETAPVKHFCLHRSARKSFSNKQYLMDICSKYRSINKIFRCICT